MPRGDGCLRVRMVGAAGFELATPCTPCKCATRLRYAPTDANYIREREGAKRGKMRQARNRAMIPDISLRNDPAGTYCSSGAAA